MISFIVVGKNEGWKLSKCLQSIYAAIKKNNLSKYEVIYVDSNSIDDSIDRAKQFVEVRLFSITGECNSAIARNIGAREAHGAILFFIDGDMEIEESFLSLVYNEKKGLLDDFTSGQLVNYNYDRNYKLLNTSLQYKSVLRKNRIEVTSGGIFLIKADIWRKFGGMDSRFKRGQDLEFSLRLAKKKIYLHRKKEIIAKHHTISYTNPDRMWKSMFSSYSFSKSQLYRKHFLNLNLYRKMVFSDYSLFILLIVILLYSITRNYSYLFIYLFIILYKSLLKNKKSFSTKINLFAYYPVRDIHTLTGLFIFFPKRKKEEYKQIT